MSEISKLAELRKLMRDMERAMGLETLSPVERDIYYAATDLANEADGIRTNTLLGHKLVSEVSRPTFFRALKTLVEKGYLIQTKSIGRGQYMVKDPST